MSYHVTVRNPEEVQADLCRLWRDNLHLGRSAEEKFDWLYRRTPEVADAVLILETAAGQAVGTNGMVPRRFWVAGREVRAVLSADLAVDRDHRALLPAMRLVRALRAEAATRGELLYGFPNEKAEGVLARAGFRELGKVVRWARVLRHAHYAPKLSKRESLPKLVRRAAANRPAARLAGAVVDAFRLVADGPHTARAAARHRMRWCDRLDPRFDQLWQDARRSYAVVGQRTARFLAWRFAGARFATLERRSDRALRGYAVVELDGTTQAAHVRDLFGFPEDFPALVDLLVPLAFRAGAASLSIRFLGAPKLQALLAKRGFVPRGAARPVVVDVGAGLAAETATLTDPNAWHLFDADEDS